jgi:hypothetical protein
MAPRKTWGSGIEVTLEYGATARIRWRSKTEAKTEKTSKANVGGRSRTATFPIIRSISNQQHGTLHWNSPCAEGEPTTDSPISAHPSRLPGHISRPPFASSSACLSLHTHFTMSHSPQPARKSVRYSPAHRTNIGLIFHAPRWTLTLEHCGEDIHICALRNLNSETS